MYCKHHGQSGRAGFKVTVGCCWIKDSLFHGLSDQQVRGSLLGMSNRTICSGILTCSISNPARMMLCVSGKWRWARSIGLPCLKAVISGKPGYLYTLCQVPLCPLSPPIQAEPSSLALNLTMRWGYSGIRELDA